MSATHAPLRKNYRWLPVNTIVRKGDHQHFTVTASRLTVRDGARAKVRTAPADVCAARKP